ncbi:EGF-like repeat and discoidin I-like domain-containing protein 3 isoform X1 [Oncorhynchus tshawytscha]|uniref:F5/8 type C domain-containing protein n=1 Tax=Oncorhynchus tshawytscha TaxID=74940 RepID=A0A8C8IKU9_ONCTS|nr:EGF-like repeat and discoidin I-like domain-containing protein 3 isoform X1 [Oncorhynchus tshawytscha]
MLSRQNSRSSFGASLRALFLVEDLEKRPMAPVHVDGPVIKGYDERGKWHSGNFEDVLAMNRSSEKSLTNTSQSDLSLNDIKDRISVRESSNKDTISVSEGKDTVSMTETLPDVTEGSPTKEYILFISETEMDYNRKSWTEEGTMKNSSVVENGTVDAEMSLMKKECCPFECSGSLGMEGGIISNQQITASSTHRALFGLQKWYPYFARLNKKGLVNAWTAAENDRWPWIQINLQRRMRVTGLITQGAKRIGSPEYVKSYKVASSDDGKTWRTYKVKGTDEDMIFRGNVENNAPSANSFTPPIEAQYVRIYPQVCRRHCTLRMELLGCELTGCSEPMGMKSGHIQDYQVTASSLFRTLNMDMFTWEPGKARLDKQGKVNAWTSGHSDQSQWLQVDMLLPTKITGIITQGAKDFGHVQFVGSYKVAYSNDGERWLVYQDEKQRKDKVFQGNFDNDTHRKNVIDPPIYARFVRILPWSWYGRITLRAELLGCTEEE